MLSTKFRAARKDHSRSAQTPTHFSLTPRVLLVSGLAIALVACAPATVTSGNGGSGGGKGGSGGNQSGGSGGNQSGGSGGWWPRPTPAAFCSRGKAAWENRRLPRP